MAAFADPQANLLALIERKDKIEKEIQQITEILTTTAPPPSGTATSRGGAGAAAAASRPPGDEPPSPATAPVGLTGNLTDAEGFPRHDIDVYAVRAQRHRLACLQTDHKAVMKEVEQALFARHATARASGAVPARPSVEAAAAARRAAAANPAANGNGAPAAAPVTREAREERLRAAPPFAVVNTVADGGPAAEAGLCAGDRVVAFGDVGLAQSECALFQAPELSEVAAAVGANVGRALAVYVRRRVFAVDAATQTGTTREELVRLEVTPHAWGGRGVLGCHLLPAASS